MQSYLLGFIVLLLNAFLFALYFYVYKSIRNEILAFATLLLGFSIRVLMMADPFLHPWDERYHALVAKNLTHNLLEPRLYYKTLLPFNPENWTQGGIWLHKQPFTLWLMSISVELFGISEISIRLPSLLLSTLGVWLTYLIAKKLTRSVRIALFAMFFHAVNGLVLEIGSGRVATDHVDLIFMVLIEVAILLIVYQKKGFSLFSTALIGTCCGLALLTKWAPALIIFPVYLVFQYGHKKNRLLLLETSLMSGFAVAIALPWQYYVSSKFPLEYAWEMHHVSMHIWNNLEGHAQPWWFFIKQIRININETLYLHLILFLYLFRFPHITERKTWLLLFTWITLPFLIFSFAMTKMQGYLLFSYPAYFIVMGITCNYLIEKHQLKQKRLSIFGLILVATVALSVRYCYERMKPLQSHELAYKAKMDLQNSPLDSASVVLNTPFPIETMFYTDAIAYGDKPTHGMVDSLQEMGYKVYVFDDLSDEVKQFEHPRVEKLRLPNLSVYMIKDLN
jgi:4-amino-4-deoxy-L-arabinose transferase-like glycosyltransferase